MGWEEGGRCEGGVGGRGEVDEGGVGGRGKVEGREREGGEGEWRGRERVSYIHIVMTVDSQPQLTLTGE